MCERGNKSKASENKHCPKMVSVSSYIDRLQPPIPTTKKHWNGTYNIYLQAHEQLHSFGFLCLVMRRVMSCGNWNSLPGELSMCDRAVSGLHPSSSRLRIFFKTTCKSVMSWSFKGSACVLGLAGANGKNHGVCPIKTTEDHLDVSPKVLNHLDALKPATYPEAQLRRNRNTWKDFITQTFPGTGNLDP